MSKTKIEWCARPGTQPETWNPTTGCDKVSQGCKNCYAEVMHRRLRGMYPEKYSHDFLGTVKTHEDVLTLPLTWKKPRTVFVNSMSDLFHEQVPFDFIDKVFAIMALTPQHTYQVLTKRADRMKEYMDQYEIGVIEDLADEFISEFFLPRGLVPPLPWYWENFGKDEDGIHQGGKWEYDDPNISFLPNVWMGVSVEDQKAANERIPFLLQVPAAIRFLSCEPLLGKINLDECLRPAMDLLEAEAPGLTKAFGELMSAAGINYINWVIAGGESGHHARPMHPDWVRNLRDQCRTAVVPFFFKQWGQWVDHDNYKALHEQFYFKKGHCQLYLGIKGNELELPSPHTHITDDTLVGESAAKMYMVGKHHSGNLIDGRKWNQFPKARREDLV